MKLGGHLGAGPQAHPHLVETGICELSQTTNSLRTWQRTVGSVMALAITN